MKKHGLLLTGLLIAVMSSGCAQTPQPPKRIGMPNPASEYCIKVGGTLELRNEAGGQVGYCHLPNGKVVEEWQLFRRARW